MQLVFATENPQIKREGKFQVSPSILHIKKERETEPDRRGREERKKEEKRREEEKKGRERGGEQGGRSGWGTPTAARPGWSTTKGVKGDGDGASVVYEGGFESCRNGVSEGEEVVG